MNGNEPQSSAQNASARKFGWLLVALCLVVLGADFFYEKTAHYAWEGAPGFQALFGVGSCLVAVFAAKAWRRILKRDEDYYD